MSSLRKNLLLFFSGDLDKAIKTVLQDNYNYIDEKSYESNQLAFPSPNFQEFLDAFNQSNTDLAKEKVCERLLTRIAKTETWSGSLRGLMVIHKFIHELGYQGYDPSDIGNSKRTAKFSKFKAEDISTAAIAHASQVRYYYTYLQRLSYGYDDFQVCFYPGNKLPESFIVDGLPFLNFLNRVQNILQYLIQLLPSIEVSFLKFPEIKLMKQLAYFYLTDCFYFYSYLNQALVSMLADIFRLSSTDSLCLYEIYLEHIELTKKLKTNFELAKYLEEFEIKIPNFYQVNPEFETRLEAHISSLKDGKLKNNQKEPLKSWSPSHGCYNPKEVDFKSVKNISKIVLSIVHADKDGNKIGHSILFKPPKPSDKGAISAANTKVSDVSIEKEAEIVFKREKTDRTNLEVQCNQEVQSAANASFTFVSNKEMPKSALGF